MIIKFNNGNEQEKREAVELLKNSPKDEGKNILFNDFFKNSIDDIKAKKDESEINKEIYNTISELTNENFSDNYAETLENFRKSENNI